MSTTAPEAVAICRRCGATTDRPGAKFCPSCGMPLAASQAGRWITITLVIVVLAALVAVGALFSARRVSSVGGGTPPALVAVAVDLSSSPTALLSDGPTADRMSLSGYSIGSPLSEDRRIDGNEFLVADGKVSQIAIGRSDLLRACRVREERDILRQFGDEPTAVQRDGAYVSYDYARRGIVVEWDAHNRRINRIILRAATAE